MLTAIILLLLSLIDSSSCSFTWVRCGQNERIARCGFNECQQTCANPNPNPNCTAPCKSGCVCTPGYLRNTKGECVRPSECDTCGKNEVFSLCDANECVATCQWPDMEMMCKPEACRPGCKCSQGTVRDANNTCVSLNECKVVCEDTEAVSVPCGDPCPETCNRNRTRSCPQICIVNGCKCKEGYVVGSEGWCVNKTECHRAELPQCPEGEFYDMCPPFDIDESICLEDGHNITDKYHMGEQQECEPVCQCIEGLIRAVDGKCKKPDVCCQDLNEEYVACPNPCDGGTCHQLDFSDCSKQCKAFGCQCKKGFVRENEKLYAICVPVGQCEILLGKNGTENSSNNTTETNA